MKKKIRALFDGSTCFGIIEIINTNRPNKTAYVSWSIFKAEGKPIGGLINNYFLGNEDFSDEEVFDLVKDQIQKYRIGRKRVFSNVEFEP